jgi:uncharacterized protein (TIGR02996 family)
MHCEFLPAILEHPDDDLPRLIYADRFGRAGRDALYRRWGGGVVL